MTTNNKEIKEKAKKEGVYLWEIADRLNIQDSNFSRKLRKELPTAEKERILSIIEDIAKGRDTAVVSA
ncbi:MAG: hypothetical protein PUE69_00835 [Ruminococcus sp.]|nr:hypothetical protein [Ruminococcus sp.]